MGKRSRSKKRTMQANKPSQRARKPKVRSRSSGGLSPLVWVGAVVIFVAAAALIVWQSGALAGPPTPSRGEDPIDLLLLADAVRPLHGTHDMALIPQHTPVPQLAPSGVAVPRLDMPSVSYDFGRVPKREDVVHIFALQNVGTADLIVSNVVTSYACTTADLSSSMIPPGQRADLTVNFDPDFHEVTGQVTRTVWFATNDPTQPWVEVRIIGDVQA